MARPLPVLLLVAVLGLLALATGIGMWELWPSERTIDRPRQFAVQPVTQQAEVVGIARDRRCNIAGPQACRRITVELRSGSEEGTRAAFTVADPRSAARVDIGDRVRVYENRLPEGATSAPGVRLDRFSLADFERRSPLLWLAVAFAVLVVVVGRWRGLRALVGLGGSLLIVVGFIVPSILDGRSPTAVALVGSLAVMLVTIPLAHGFGVKAVAACLGTAGALLLTLGLAHLFVNLAHLSGLSSDEAIFLRATTGDISVQGLLLAGMLIGALGVLDDLTVTQASTVLALRRVNSRLGFRELFGSAFSVGHDHIAATVNTLVLAYAGAALPVLLIFNLGGTSFSDAVNTEAVAAQIVATLVGSIGLIAAVPVTTALAAVLATQVDAATLEREAAHHAH